MQYELPPNCDAYKDWTGHASRTFQPTPRQQLVIAAVRESLALGHQYTTQYVAHAASVLKPTPEQLASNRNKVESGDFGYDVYFARQYIREQEQHAAVDRAAEELKLSDGKVLGTLMFSDFKRTTGVKVTKTWDNGLGCEFEGKRGAYRVTGKADALTLKHAIQRAKERATRNASRRASA